MSWIDWLIALFPLVLVAFVGWRAQRYVKGVSDFLSAGRVAGRYVVAVAGGEAGMGLISVIAIFEAYYNSGLAYGFWNAIAAPLGMLLMLTGYCIYRYRETRAMTMGQFLEMRYNRKFRIFAGFLQAISGVVNYAIFPAVGARFLVYFCDLPLVVSLGGWEIPTFMLVMAVFLSVAVFVASIGGQITIMATDCVQGIMSYMIYVILIAFLLSKFSWFNDIVPPLLNRPEGKSFLNPFDIHKLRDFNIFFVSVGIFSTYIFNRIAWSGTQGYNSAAKNAHEQKMGGVLGGWRTGLTYMIYALVAVCAYAYLNGDRFTKEAVQCRSELAVKAMADVGRGVDTGSVQEEFNAYVASGEKSPELDRYIALADQRNAEREAEIHASKVRWGLLKDAPPESGAVESIPEVEQPNLEAVLGVGAKALQGYGEATGQKVSSQSFTTIFGQMRIPMALKSLLPIGITGLFCALCVFLLISTDTTYLHSWAGIIVQDVILPLRGKPFTPRQHMKMLRVLIVLVALFAFIFSSFFAQVDFIMMFFAVTGMIWLGGAGSCIVGGLYWKRGTTAGAFTALVIGSTLGVSGIILQKTWESGLYPWLESRELVGAVAVWLERLSAPFNPYIVWEMSPTKFPINSQEMYFFAMMLSILGYVVVSLLTCKVPHNMDRLLHRGEYHREGEAVERGKPTSFRGALNKLIGINSQYTRGDRILARSVFAYSFLWIFGSFLAIVVWNRISPWPREWWGVWYFITMVCVLGALVLVSVVWFTIGGTRDLVRMFADLKAKDTNILDDGRVIGNVSADDVAIVEAVEHTTIEEAHVEERGLEESLKKEDGKKDRS